LPLSFPIFSVLLFHISPPCNIDQYFSRSPREGWGGVYSKYASLPKCKIQNLTISKTKFAHFLGLHACFKCCTFHVQRESKVFIRQTCVHRGSSQGLGGGGGKTP
jgi:hypothetical protein